MLRNRSDPAGILTATWAKKAQLSSLVKNGLAVTASSLLSAVQILKTMPTDTYIENAWKQARLKHQTDGIIPKWADVIAWSELHRSTPLQQHLGLPPQHNLSFNPGFSGTIINPVVDRCAEECCC